MAAPSPLPAATAEATLAALEAAFGITITVRDLTGWLRRSDGSCLVDPARNSHKRQTVCARGFTPACVEHCRHQAGAAMRRAPGVAATCCWKGVREVLVPVVRHGSLQGYLFAGAWRDGPRPTGPWAADWRRLPAWDPARADAVAAILVLAADGLWAAAERARAAELPAGRAGRIRAFLRADLARGRSGLARHLGLSPSRTSHAVRETCGTSLQRLLIEERLAAAKRLLAEGDLPVAAVGSAVGWTDPPHFARTFRRLTGRSPGAWRTAHRQA